MDDQDNHVKIPSPPERIGLDELATEQKELLRKDLFRIRNIERTTKGLARENVLLSVEIINFLLKWRIIHMFVAIVGLLFGVWAWHQTIPNNEWSEKWIRWLNDSQLDAIRESFPSIAVIGALYGIIQYFDRDKN